MKRVAVVFAGLVAFLPAVATAGPTFSIIPSTLKAGEVSLAVVSVQLDSAAPTPLGLFSSFNVQVPGVDLLPSEFPQVFINDTPTGGIELISTGTDSVMMLVSGAGGVVVPPRAVIWFKVRIRSVLPSVRTAVFLGGGALDVGTGTAVLGRIAFVDFDLVPPGPAGAPGATGAPGAPGQSVMALSEPPGENCPTGGQRLNSATGVTYVCNGAVGAPGQPGVPAGGLLLLAPGSPRPVGFSLIGTLFGYALLKKD